MSRPGAAPAGTVAAGLQDVVEAVTEVEGEAELIETALEALTTTLPFRRAGYLSHTAGRLHILDRGEGDPDIDLDERAGLRRALDTGDVFLWELDGPSLLEEALQPIRPEDVPPPGRLVIVPVSPPEGLAGAVVLVEEDVEPGAEVDPDPDPRALQIASLYGVLLSLGLRALSRARRLEELRAILQERNQLLADEVSSEADACHALERAVSRSMRTLVESAKQVARTDAPVLVTGETGSGKEVLSRAIHEWSDRADGPFVQLNCAALSDHLIESELFGHVRGAFSGAVSDRPGRFRVADGGTLLLDEIGDMPMEAQTKLLRVLETGSVLPVGADRPIDVDVRVIAATNVDLDLAIDQGRFREDLYFRLHVFPLHIPPLRARPEDLEGLTEQILERMRRRTGLGPWRVSASGMERMRRYAWPGNVRELVNALERARVFAPLGGTLDPRIEDRGPRGRRRGRAWPTMDQHQRAYLEEVLEHTGGKIYGEGGAAELLDLPPSTLQSRMRKLGVERASS